MNWTELIHQYGWLAIAAGTFFEGEWAMLAAGIGVRAGWLSPWTVVLAGMGGTFASDMACFWFGRLGGPALVQRWPRLWQRLAPVRHLMERNQALLIVGYQFVPGLCTVTPIAFGLSRIRASRFMALNAIGIVAWTGLFASGGYACATVLLDGYGLWLLVPAAAGAIGAVWGYRRIARALSRRAAGAAVRPLLPVAA
jgi:membrane protein DedA with SNARE-associated domain